MTNVAQVERVRLRAIKMPGDVTGVGAIIKLDNVPIEGTVLSKEFQENGGVIDFDGLQLYDNWGRVIQGITIPAIPVTYEMGRNSIAVLHPIAVRANLVARMLEEVHKKERKFASLQKAVNAFYLEICNTLFGKSGVFNRWILGPRLKNSFRAVVIPGKYDKDPLGESYEWVGIPEKICRKVGISTGDIVIIGRDPTIWMGSVEFLYAYPVSHDSIEIHPLLLPQFAGDHDGDQLWGYKPDPELLHPGIVADFTRKFATWSKNFNCDQETNDVQWRDFLSDERNRIQTNGLSVSPLEVIEGGESLDRVLGYCSFGKRNRGKVDSANELLEISQQVNIDEWKQKTQSINTAQLAMKIFMGPVGLLALRLIAIGHKTPKVRESANILAERCAQGLLDAKHLTYEQAKNFKPSDIFKILNLTIELNSAKQMLIELQKIVPCDERVLPILEYILKDGRGVARMSQEDMPLFEGITSTASMDIKGYMPKFILDEASYTDEGIISFAFWKGLVE